MRLHETESMAVADADRGQQNERWEGLGEVQVINVARRVKGRSGIVNPQS